MSTSMKKLAILLIVLGAACPALGQDSVKWVFTNYPPANFQMATGRYSGFLHDMVLELFQERLGLPVDIATFPWKRCQLMVKQGKADIMVTIPTPERLEYALTHIRPIWIKRRVLYTYHGHPRIKEIQRIHGIKAIKEGGYRVVSYLGNGWTEKKVEDFGIPVVYSSTVAGMYRMLAAKRGDLIIEEKGLATPQITHQGLSGKIEATTGIGSESGFHILIGKKSPHANLISKLDREVEAMRNQGRLEQILDQYSITPRE